MKFYSKLCKKSDVPINLINKCLNDVHLPNYLMTADRKMCDLDTLLLQISERIKRLKQNKSPGMDGLTCKFYQTF